jgi:eukaryotic-like serine/threonine-protein kinase
MKSFFRYVLLALVLLVVALVSALTAMRFAIHVSEVSVPNLTRLPPSEARRKIEENGLHLEVERQFYSAEIPEGRILSQVPTANARVRRGWTVRVAVSLGPQRITIPSVVGQTERAAEINIRRRGLDIGTIAAMQMPGTPADQVLSQNPSANASGVSAPKISLLVAESSDPQAFVMPSFVGEALGTVKLALQDAGLRVGSVGVSPQFSERSASGEFSAASLVVTQNPGAGEKVAAGAAVNLEVR